MNTFSRILVSTPPESIDAALRNWPQRDYTSSPSDWRDQVFYFLLIDRFSNGRESPEDLLPFDLSTGEGLEAIRRIRGAAWRWDRWRSSGAERFQGGTLKGIASKLGYLRDLGITTIWISPVFRQRVELNTYHGYGIQNFFDIDPRFGTRQDLVDLVDEAHGKDMRVVLDVIFNHAGSDFLYDPSAGNSLQPPYRQSGGYEPIWPRNGFGSPIYDPAQQLCFDDYIWPNDFQEYRNFMRAGSGSLGSGSIDDPFAEHKRTDFCDLRKFNLYSGDTLRSLILCYHYWIALADVDGFRIDTFKHVTQDQARTFCNGIKEYAESLGKDNFFLVAEVAGGDSAQDRYLDVTGRNLNACLDIGEQRERICGVAKGLATPSDYFNSFDYYDLGMGSHRNYGSRHMSISNDHDHVFGEKVRFSANASNDHQATAAAAIQLFTLGIPCIYYGMEQGLAGGAEPDQRGYCENWGGNDVFLREAMFGPDHPLASGYDGTQGESDPSLPGFGPHGTSGRHVFNPLHPIYTRIALLALIRARFKPLRRGRQYQREISVCHGPFLFHGQGEIMAWSRVFDNQEIVVIVNTHGVDRRGARVTVDGILSAEGMTVVANTDPDSTNSRLHQGALLAMSSENGRGFLELDRDWLLGPSEVIVCANEAAISAANLPDSH